MKNQEYQICSKCIMDTVSDPDIFFNHEGICNYCTSYNETFQTRHTTDNNAFSEILNKMKEAGKNKEYDCIIGVSGGVDSTYIAYLLKENGINPLAIHFDNGWNSELAVSNIEKVLKILDIDLYTYVIDWEEFKDLQLSFLKASTPDSEIPTDHAIYALLLREANKRNIKYLISGMNYKTESIAPPSWSYGHSDWKYIKSVHKIFGNIKLKKYPHYSLLYLFYSFFVRRVKMVSLLNYMDYDKEKAMKLIEDKLGWKYYGGKHYESIYTRFFQAYILPQKFEIDKRKGHLSNLISSGQMTRQQAMEEFQKETYPKNLLEQDKEFVIKKFGLTENSFQEIMDLPKKTHRDYKSNYKTIKRLKTLYNYLRRINLFHK